MVTLTAYLLCALLTQKVKVVLCDEQRNPMGEILPYYGCHNASGRVQKQLLWTEAQKLLIWQAIIKQKIRNQAGLLKIAFPDEGEMLLVYARDLDPGDATNRECHASKV